MEIASPNPQSSSPSSATMSRTPSPPRNELGGVVVNSKEQMDALPKTPRKAFSATAGPRPVRRIVQLEPLPRFSDVSEGQWEKLFAKKIGQCEIVFDFSMPIFDCRSREIKTNALADLLMFVKGHGERMVSEEGYYEQVCVMFAKNVFRALPPNVNPQGEEFDPEDDEPQYDSSWPHVQIVYEIFIRFVELNQFNVNIAKKWIDQLFVYRLMALFDVEDPREREMVKTAVHRVYGKFLNLRAFIRRNMRHLFCEFMYEDVRHYVGEMLEILGSVVNGFALPLREEHKTFLQRTLIPLHKTRTLPAYFPQLSLCIIQFAEKDASLVPMIITGLLKLWPKVNTTKELMFLSEIEEIIDVTPAEVLSTVIIPLCNQLSKCIASSHFQVAERALHYWNNEYFTTVLADHASNALPIILPAMLQHSRTHWNRSVQMQVLKALGICMDMSPRLYESIVSSLDESFQRRVPQVNTYDDRRQRWAKVEEQAYQRTHSTSRSQLELSKRSQSPPPLSQSPHHIDSQKSRNRDRIVP